VIRITCAPNNLRPLLVYLGCWFPLLMLHAVVGFRRLLGLPLRRDNACALHPRPWRSAYCLCTQCYHRKVEIACKAEGSVNSSIKSARYLEVNVGHDLQIFEAGHACHTAAAEQSSQLLCLMLMCFVVERCPEPAQRNRCSDFMLVSTRCRKANMG
jgi:hypothetical protein